MRTSNKLDASYLDTRMKRRFYAFVYPEPNTGCWLWGGRSNKKGYGLGSFNVNGRPAILAHRYSYLIHNNTIDDHLMVLHKCDIPCCVNPQHLYQGNGQHNANDRDSRGRNAQPKGSQNGNASLKEVDVIAIRSEYSEGIISSRKLAKKYNVSQFTIMCIVRYKTWKHV